MNDKEDPSDKASSDETRDRDDPGAEVTPGHEKPALVLDEDGIPILDEIIRAGGDSISDQDTPFAAPPAAPGKGQMRPSLVLPNHRTVLAALRRSLKEQLNAELAEVIQETARSAAKQTSRDLKQLIQDQLTQSLEIRLKTLIEQALDEQFGDNDS